MLRGVVDSAVSATLAQLLPCVAQFLTRLSAFHLGLDYSRTVLFLAHDGSWASCWPEFWEPRSRKIWTTSTTDFKVIVQHSSLRVPWAQFHHRSALVQAISERVNKQEVDFGRREQNCAGQVAHKASTIHSSSAAYPPGATTDSTVATLAATKHPTLTAVACIWRVMNCQILHGRCSDCMMLQMSINYIEIELNWASTRLVCSVTLCTLEFTGLGLINSVTNFGLLSQSL